MSINSTCTGSASRSGGGSASGDGNSGSGGGPCGACKFLRRKCVPGCIFAPYFDSEQGATHFAAVHKIFGASNVSKLLLNIPVHKRLDAVVTICYEAQARLRDPVYGCVAHIFALQQQVVSLQAELTYLQAHLATLELPHPPPPPPSSQATITPPVLSISDLPTTPTTIPIPVTYDLSTLFEPMTQYSWAIQHRSNLDQHQFLGNNTSSSSPSEGGGNGNDDLQVLARELLRRHERSSSSAPMVSNAPSSHSPSK